MTPSLHTSWTPWRKSSRSSGGGNASCLEAALLTTLVAIRDSKHCSGSTYPVLAVDRPTWTAFLAGLQ